MGYQINGKDIKNVIANNPSFSSKLNIDDLTSKYQGFPTDTVWAKKLTDIGWGEEYTNFPYRCIDENGQDRTPKFLTKESCRYPSRTIPTEVDGNDPILSWGSLVISNGQDVTIYYDIDNKRLCTYTHANAKTEYWGSSPLIFIDLCGGGGGGGGVNSGGNGGGGGGGGGGASAFMAINVKTAGTLYVKTGQGGSGGSSGKGGTDGTQSYLNINSENVVYCGGGKGGEKGSGTGKAAGGAGGTCGGSLWDGEKFNTGKGIKSIKGYHGKPGGESNRSEDGNGNRGGSFQPSKSTDGLDGSDYIPNFGVIPSLKIGKDWEGNQNNVMGIGGRESWSSSSYQNVDQGGGGGACAMGCSKDNSVYVYGGNGGNGNTDIKTDGAWSGAGTGVGRSGGDGYCVLHMKY